MKKAKGSTLTEVVIVAGILSTVSLAFLGTFAVISKFHEKNLRAIKAGLLAEEGMEAVRIIKGRDFNTLSTLAQSGPSTPQYLEVSPSTWNTTTTPEVVDNLYYRYFVVSPAYRTVDSDPTQSSAGNTLDPNTVYVDVTVEWLWRNATTSNSYKAFMTNL